MGVARPQKQRQDNERRRNHDRRADHEETKRNGQLCPFAETVSVGRPGGQAEQPSRQDQKNFKFRHALFIFARYFPLLSRSNLQEAKVYLFFFVALPVVLFVFFAGGVERDAKSAGGVSHEYKIYRLRPANLFFDVVDV